MVCKSVIFSILFCLIMSVSAQNKVKTKVASNWEVAVTKAKTDACNRLDSKNMPVVSGVMKLKTPSQKISVDVTGWSELALYTWGTADGSRLDHAVWGNAKLITADGKTVWLEELTPTYMAAPFKAPGKNKNMGGKAIQINGQGFEHGVILHADGEMIFDLGKKFKTFEAEVGIDDGAGSQSSVVFRVQNVSGHPIVSQLAKTYPAEIAQIEEMLNVPAELWITTKDASLERAAVASMMKKLTDQSYFIAQMAVVDKKAPVAQSLAYMNLLDKANRILVLQEELSWVNLKAIRMALDDMKKQKGFDGAKYETKYNELVSGYPMAVKAIYTGDETALATAQRMLDLKREILLANPLLDMDKIVVSRFNLGNRARSAMAGSLGTPPNNWSSMYSASRTGQDAEIAELSNLRGNIQKRTIYKPERKVNIADLQMHWDADKLLFSSVDENNKWQVYEVGVDGQGFQQKVKVNEPDLEFCDANYLPDGRIMASSNIGYHGVPCVNGSDAVGNMALYDPKTGSLRRLAFDQDGNWNPVVMNNGRVMYTRWEYTDLTHYFSRIVMHMNPDGTENKALYGSGSFWPNSTFDIKPLPGNTSRFVGIISGHHGVVRSGRLMIFDPAKSRKEEKGVVQEMPFRDRKIIPEVKDQLVNGVWPQFIRPFPLNDDYYLVSAKLTPSGLWGIYLVDVFDNLTCIAEFEGEGLNAPMPVLKVKTPPAIPDRVNLNDKEATVFIQDIYEGEGSKGLPKGVVKELRIFAYEYAYRNSPSDHDAQGVQSGWDIKRLLGTVPVEEDGSVIFKVPANMPISIQPLDAEGRALQWMRSWFTPMPGETVSCVGCHEDQNQIPMPKRTIASQIKPHALKSPEGGVRSYTFNLEVQPILDRACVACHDGSKAQPDFTSGRIDTMRRGSNNWMVRPWSKSYLAFMPYIYRQGPEAEMYVLKPYEYHATNSEMVQMLTKGHHGVKLTDKEWRSLYNWIDFNAPYNGSFDNLRVLNGYDQYERRMELMEKYNGVKVDWRKEIKDYAAYLEGKGKITAEMPAPVKKTSAKEVKVRNWPFSAAEAKQKQTASGKAAKEIEVAPGIKMKFVWIPSGEFVMGSNTADRDCAPAFKASVKDGFWMSETEVTNEQYCVLFPEHNSRIIGQFWKDHTTAGLPANKPHQPVIRVSNDEAMAYCQKLGEKSGLRMSLPTETQWEWACRGGSDGSFWYGTSNTDFSKYENLADIQLADMAVQGVDPKPMPKNSSLRKYWDYIPKVASVDDGEMLTAFVGKYQSNPWGLKDMHGNVAEWTCSDYVSYPLKKVESGEQRVVRGGSWTDRPKLGASHSRRAFYPWQRPYNVGFRVIIEE